MDIDSVINTKMLGHPVNWLIVWTVLLFAGFAYALAHEYFGPVKTQ
jgi:hypothetical protein